MLQDVEQVRDLHAGMAGDEMQHAVMRAAEAEFGEGLVGVADEVAVGEKQQFDEVPDRLSGPARTVSCVGRVGTRSVGNWHSVFMSAILTYFG